MPPNQSPLANILQWFQGGRPPQNPMQGNRPGPYFGGNPYGLPPGPNPNAPFSGGPPVPFSQNNAGPFGFGDLLRNFRNLDITKVIEGINTFRNFLSNAQKAISTIQQLSTAFSNVQKIMSQIDVSGLLNLLNSDPSSSDVADQGDPLSEATQEPKPRPPKKKKASIRKKKRKQMKRRKLQKRKTGQIQTKKSVPLFKMP